MTRVLFVSGQPYSTRNVVVLKGLRKNGINPIECTHLSKSYFTRYPYIIGKLILKIMDDFDFVYLGFFSQPLVPFVKKLRSEKVIFDAFLSAYDTLCFDREKYDPRLMIGKALYNLDKYSCELSDTVLLDTNAHINYFVDTFNLDRNKFHRILVGADESLFYPQGKKRTAGKFQIFFYGNYLPLQGIEYIIEAAKLLEKHDDIEFKIIGNGMVDREIAKLVRDLEITNIKFIKWVPYEQLPVEIANSDLCLGGHFSNINKAKRVISGKTYHFLSMRKPVIVGDNEANREIFENKKHVIFVEHANPHALSDAILSLKYDEQLRERVAEGGYKLFKSECTTTAIGREIKQIILKL